MKIIQSYETVLNIDARDMYSGDLNAVILNQLKRKYEGKCEKNTLVSSIKDISKRSMCRMAQDRLDGSGNINVQFTADAIVYENGDILTGCEVQRIDRNNRIICKHDLAVIIVKANRILQSLKAGQKITIKISNVSYLSGRDKINIYGSPYSYSYHITLYSTILSSDITAENCELLKKKLIEIENEVKMKVDQKLINFFNETFYPFQTKFNESKKEIKGDFELVDLIALTKQVISPDPKNLKGIRMYICRHPIIEKSTPLAMQIKKEEISGPWFDPKTYDVNICQETIGIVLWNLLNDYLNHIRMIREMTEIYPTEKDLESHRNIWDIYRNLKK